MNIDRRKELLESYKNRRPEMGLISYRCTTTGHNFVNYAPDTKAAFNSTSFKLSTGSHPNKQLQIMKVRIDTWIVLRRAC